MRNSGGLKVEQISVLSRAGPILSDVSFKVDPGCLTVLTGPSGSGKTTLIKLIAGLLHDDLFADGEILLNGDRRSLGGKTSWENDIALVLQGPLESMNPIITAGRFLQEVVRANRPNIPNFKRGGVVKAALERVGLDSDVADRFPDQISGGERQRVLIAATLLLEPKLLLADEPTAALDTASKQEVLSLLRDLAQERGIPILVATHDLRAVRDIAETAIVLSAGRLESVMPTKALRTPSFEDLPAPAAGGDPVVIAKDISKRYGNRQILDKLSISLDGGSRVGLTGPSGCGKTTLARCLAGLVNVEGGTVERYNQSGIWKRVLSPGPSIQMIFQEPYASFDPRLSLASSIAEAVAFSNPNLSRRESHSMAIQALSRSGIDGATALRRPQEVSGGECQRAAITRAIVGSPTLVIADEPLSSLDFTWEHKIIELLWRAQHEHGFALLLISHNTPLLAETCSELFFLVEGRIVAQDPSKEILHTSKAQNNVT